MRTVVITLLAMTLAIGGWLWWRGDTVATAPEVRAIEAAPLPVVTGDFDQVATDCRADVPWESVHARPWQALSQRFAGTVDVCVELYRDVAGSSAQADAYVALVTSAWSTAERSDYWWPWDGRDDAPGVVDLSVKFAGARGDGASLASNPATGACVTALPATSVALGGTVTEAPLVMAGSCDESVALGPASGESASWSVPRPEEWDLVVMSCLFEAEPGTVPTIELVVTGAPA